MLFHLTASSNRLAGLHRSIRTLAVGTLGLALTLLTACPGQAQLHRIPAVGTGGGGPGTGGQPLPMTHANILTQHNDNQRTGVNPNETVLTPAVIRAGFGKLYSRQLDGQVYGQPLFVSDIYTTNIYGTQSTFHKGLVIVVTENNSIYAFDADSNTGTNTGPVWWLNYNFPQSQITPVPGNDIIDQALDPQQDIQPIIGITGTPVIDPSTGTLYVVVRTKEYLSYVQRLHAIDIHNGLEKYSSPVDIDFTVPGTGDGADSNGNISFDTRYENQRPALLLNNGVVYISYCAHGNAEPYHGYIVGYNAQTLNEVGAFITTPNAAYSYAPFAPPVGGGVDMSGAGPATDASGANIFASVGIGLFDVNSGGTDYGESVVKLSASNISTPADYFTPYNVDLLNNSDTDLGSGGIVVLPDSLIPTAPHLLAADGTGGTIYLINRDNLGQFNSAADNVFYEQANATGPIFGLPAYFNGNLYYHGIGDVLHSFKINPTAPYLVDTTPSNPGTTVVDFPGATPSISANGVTNGLVWEILPYYPPNGNPPIATLAAYDASNVSSELYNSLNSGARDSAGNYVKYTVPTVANGKVFVGADSQLTVFGPTTTSGPAQATHFVVTGPGQLDAFGIYAGIGTVTMGISPTLVANRLYQFSVTALGPNGAPIPINTTIVLYVYDIFTAQNLPIANLVFNNTSNAIISTHFNPGAYLLYADDQRGHRDYQFIFVRGFNTVGFDHYVINAPSSVKDGTNTQIHVSAATFTDQPITTGDSLLVYDTLPAGVQSLDDQVMNLPGSLPTSQAGCAYEFQWGAGPYSLLGEFPVGFFGQETSIPIQLHGVGKHVLIVAGGDAVTVTGTVPNQVWTVNDGGTAATRVITVTP